jgi:hypothetical protein
MENPGVNHEVQRDMSQDDPAPFPVVYSGIIGSIVVVLSVLFVATITQRLTAVESGSKSLAAGAPETRRLRVAQEQRLATGEYVVVEMETSPDGQVASVEKKIRGLPIGDVLALMIRDPKTAAEPLAPPPEGAAPAQPTESHTETPPASAPVEGSGG